MAYIGNQPTTAAFITDQFNGNGSTVAFTMSVSPANAASVLIVISGVVQDPSTYSVSGTTLTFSQAPPLGTANISARYLGVPATGIATTAYRTVTDFTATASQTTFSVPSYTVGYIDVYRNGVRLGTADYTATSGTTVVLANAATLGDLVATESFYVSSVLNAIPAAAGQVGAVYLANGAASQAFLDVASNTGTGALKLPVGTTAQRPTGATGLIRQNSTTGNPEWWDATTSQWLQFSQPVGYSVNYLIVAGGGGGGGGQYHGGGGGAGGAIALSATFSAGANYTITIGAGGAGGITTAKGSNGVDSVISTVNTAVGGGGGGNYNQAGGGNSGGSGGGGPGSSAPSNAGGAGTAGQGNAGGSGANTAGNYGAGGGGGAGAAGGSGTGSTGGNGGVGLTSSISGARVTYAGGGGGSTYNGGTPGTGGAGGGGAGTTSGTAGSGTANTGGGGGGAERGGSTTGGSGGSGIVIISYYGSQRGTGGTVTSSGGSTIHTFTSSGTYIA